MNSLRDFISAKPIEFWLILAGMTLYVTARDAEREPIRNRLVKTATAIFLTLGFASELSRMVPFLGEIGAAIVIMTVGLLVLDVATALIQDRQFIKDIIRDRMGGKR